MLGAPAERPGLLADRLAADADPDPLPALLADQIRAAFAAWCAAATARAERWNRAVTELLDQFGPARRTQLSPALLGPLDQAGGAVDALLDDPQGPEVWHAHLGGVAVLARHGADALVAGAAERGLDPRRLPEVAEQAVLRAWADDLLATDPRLRSTRSEDLDTRVADFRAADLRLVAAAGGAVTEACNERRPRNFAGAARLIRREAEKKTRHLPVRTLLGRAGRSCAAAQAVLHDEPAVGQPVPAAGPHLRRRDLRRGVPGAARRRHRLHLPGPPAHRRRRQPPAPADLVLRLRGRRRLRRVRRRLLDSFDPCCTPARPARCPTCPCAGTTAAATSRSSPSPTASSTAATRSSPTPARSPTATTSAWCSATCRGVYERGGARDNPDRGRRRGRAGAWFAEHHPELSVGVVAFSEAQATRIGWEIAAGPRDRPDLDPWFHEDRLDGFFVKNLENVQGDERDVIIFSVGYGFDEAGKLTMNFGPLNQEGGHRRLNVAITRARRRVEVVSLHPRPTSARPPATASGTSSATSTTPRRGPAVLARDDGSSRTANPRARSRRPCSPCCAAGATVSAPGRPRRLPHRPRRPPPRPARRFALGIECDGAAYHSSGRPATATGCARTC